MKLGTIGFRGERLREGREARGLTAIALAGILGVTRAAVSQYEKNVQSPRPDVMDRICQCLRLPLAFFLREQTNHQGTIYWRSQASSTQLARQAVERRLGWMQELAAQLREFVDFPTPDFPNIDLPSDPLRITNDDIEVIAMSVRKYWNLDDGPIQNAVALLENNGVLISRDDLYAMSLDGLSRWSPEDGTPYCLIASGKNSAARSRMDLYHELGHLILHRHLDQRYLVNPLIHKIVEDQAYRFAGAFALPEESFAGDIYSLSLDAFVRLKATWRVSIGMMIKRCESLELISEAQSKRLWIGMSTKGWRSVEPLDDEMPIEKPQLFAKAVDILQNQGVEPRDYLASTLALPALDIEQLAGLPDGAISGSGYRVIAMTAAKKPKQDTLNQRRSDVLEFRRDNKSS
jgi:Zn-dependent peptidase ImmA (M78 family)/transcriptional regulator with XRE-family HTH domain